MSGLSCVSLPHAERTVTAEKVSELEGRGDPFGFQTASGHRRHLPPGHTCSAPHVCVCLWQSRVRRVATRELQKKLAGRTLKRHAVLKKIKTTSPLNGARMKDLLRFLF